MQPVFVFGAHRSGTTLLQRVLNSYDDVLVWGEHAGFLRPLGEAFWAGWESPSLFGDRKPLADILADSEPFADWQAWMNWFSREDWIAAFRRDIESLLLPGGLPGKRFWGFKEIRYMARPGERTLEFLATLYPDAVFVFIVRNAFNSIASNRATPEGARSLRALKRVCDGWTRRYRAYRDWHRAGRTRSFWIVYEELIEGRGEIRALLAALGKEFGDRQRAVLESSGGRRSSFATEDYNARWAALPRAWLGVVAASVGALNAELGYPTPPLPLAARMAGRLALATMRSARD